MKPSSKICLTCKGTGWAKRHSDDKCPNCLTNKTSICYLCENIQFKLKGSWKICEQCTGSGEINSVS